MPGGLWNVICLGTKRLKTAIDDEFCVLRRVLAMYREEAGVPDAPTGDTRTWKISSVIGLGRPRREGSVSGYLFVELYSCQTEENLETTIVVLVEAV